MFSEETKTSLLEQFKAALMPRFTAKSADWLPKCAHPKDAAADIRAWIPEGNTIEELVEDIEKLQLLNRSAEVYVNGKRLNNEGDLDVLRVDNKYAYVTLVPRSRHLIKAGFKIALPELPDPLTACYRISSRSGLAAKYGIVVANSPGLIDCYYRDEVGVILENRGQSIHLFGHGARIAQGAYEILISQSSWQPEEVLEECLDETVRKGGFGHTGV